MCCGAQVGVELRLQRSQSEKGWAVKRGNDAANATGANFQQHKRGYQENKKG